MKKPASDGSGGGLKPEYRFDYANAKPNRFAGKRAQPVVVALDPDVARVFKDRESVNAVLRAIVNALPRRRRKAG